MPTIEELGQLVKQKYPAYANIPDAELGARVQQKYPGAYTQFTGTATSKKPVTSNSQQAKLSFGSKAEQKTIVNKPGFDRGDLARLAGSIPATIGAIGGGILGLPFGGVGAVVGAGIGSGVGEAARVGIGKMLGLQKNVSGNEVAKGIGKEALIGATAEVGGKALVAGVRGLKALTPSFFSFTTGLPREVFERAISNPKAVKSAMSGATSSQIAKQGQAAIEAAEKAAQLKYGEIYEQVAKQTAGTQLSKKGTQAVISKAASDLNIKLGLVKGKRVISFATSKIGDKTEQGILKSVIDDITRWPQNDAMGINILKSRISNLITPTMSPQTKRALAQIADSLDELLPDPLKQINKNYAAHLDLMKAMKKIFSPNSNKKLALQQAETAIKRIFGDNKTAQREALAMFESDTGTSIMDNIAGLLLQRVQPQVLRGLSAVGGSLGAGAAGIGGGLATAPIALAATSPRIAGEVLTRGTTMARLLKPAFKKAAVPAKVGTMQILRDATR